jgi:hypothetical protein
VLVVGNSKDFDKPLSALGPVTNVDITIPSPPAETPGAEARSSPAGASTPARAASNPEGKALAAKVVDSMGGAAKLKTVRALKAKLAQQAGDQPASQLDLIIVYPDRMHLVVDSPAGAMTIVFAPAGGFMAAQGQVRPIPPAGARESLEQIKRDPTFIAAHVDDPKFTFTANGSEKIGNVDARTVDVNADGTAIRWFVDPHSGVILRESYKAMGPSGPFEGETEFSEWKSFDGVSVPTRHVNKQDGKESSVVTFSDVHINPAVDPKLFDKPAPAAPPAQ